MRLLADESCDFAVVRSLRRAGHDVVAVVEAMPGAVVETLARHAGRLAGSFVILEPGRLRVTPLFSSE